MHSLSRSHYFSPFTQALSTHCRMQPSINTLHRPLSVAFLFQVVPSFFALSFCHFLLGRPLDLFPLLGCHSVQRLVYLLSFTLAKCPVHLHFCFNVFFNVNYLSFIIAYIYNFHFVPVLSGCGIFVSENQLHRKFIAKQRGPLIRQSQIFAHTNAGAHACTVLSSDLRVFNIALAFFVFSTDPLVSTKSGWCSLYSRPFICW